MHFQSSANQQINVDTLHRDLTIAMNHCYLNLDIILVTSMINLNDLNLDRLDSSIYKCITESIATDVVVVTGKQFYHMAERHPDVLAVILDNLNLTLQDPDYILRDPTHEDTGLVIRRIPQGDHCIHVVLRISTDTDSVHFANSVISGWKISSKRLDRYLRTREIIYKRSDQC